ncbi:MAG: heme-binding domain-containing protein [Desulfobacterales bacterium]|nr:heme-binding domain-containing protein [Desulfobacterales bacterium]
MKIVILISAVIVITIQFIQVDRTNPKVESELKAPKEVLTILKRACYDCHSNETKWPWYSKIAPISWLVFRDVDKGREYLNFSKWDGLTKEGQNYSKNSIIEQISKDRMPLWIYKIGHSDAKLSKSDKDILIKWATMKN